jgi:hypothetical protein
MRNKVSGVVRILLRNLCRYDLRFPSCRRPSDYLHDPGAARPIGLDLVRCLLPLYGCLRLGVCCALIAQPLSTGAPESEILVTVVDLGDKMGHPEAQDLSSLAAGADLLAAGLAE